MDKRVICKPATIKLPPGVLIMMWPQLYVYKEMHQVYTHENKAKTKSELVHCALCYLFQIPAAVGIFVCGVERQRMKGTLSYALIMECGVQSVTSLGTY